MNTKAAPKDMSCICLATPGYCRRPDQMSWARARTVQKFAWPPRGWDFRWLVQRHTRLAPVGRSESGLAPWFGRTRSSNSAPATASLPDRQPGKSPVARQPCNMPSQPPDASGQGQEHGRLSPSHLVVGHFDCLCNDATVSHRLGALSRALCLGLGARRAPI